MESTALSELVVIGLGNPGTAYASHRHNIGARCVAHFARRHGIALERRETRCRVGRGVVEGASVLLARPSTYMNESGSAVAGLVRKLRVPLSGLLVVYDDLDLPFGRLRLRARGSAGGHRGLASIIASLGSQEFPRLRVGIDRPGPGLDPADYVLSPFTSPERAELPDILDKAAEAIRLVIAVGLDGAMNRVNQGVAESP